jgi:hypothetical protein
MDGSRLTAIASVAGFRDTAAERRHGGDAMACLREMRILRLVELAAAGILAGCAAHHDGPVAIEPLPEAQSSAPKPVYHHRVAVEPPEPPPPQEKQACSAKASCSGSSSCSGATP